MSKLVNIASILVIVFFTVAFGGFLAWEHFRINGLELAQNQTVDGTNNALKNVGDQLNALKSAAGLTPPAPNPLAGMAKMGSIPAKDPPKK